MESKEEQHEVVGYGTYVLVWLSLVILTSLTVTVGGMHLGRLSMLTALVIAAVKAGLVFYFFMHLKYESAFFKLMLFVVLVTITIFIGFTFFDISFR